MILEQFVFFIHIAVILLCFEYKIIFKNSQSKLHFTECFLQICFMKFVKLNLIEQIQSKKLVMYGTILILFICHHNFIRHLNRIICQCVAARSKPPANEYRSALNFIYYILPISPLSRLGYLCIMNILLARFSLFNMSLPLLKARDR